MKLIFLLFLFSSSLWAQNRAVGTCGNEMKMTNQPSSMNKNTPFVSDSFEEILIPVIFHLIHQDQMHWPQIKSQFDQMNSIFNPYKIKFCLAKKTPEGKNFNYNEHSFGVTTYSEELFPESDIFGSKFYYYDYIEKIIKPQTIWEPKEYLNIWVVNAILQNIMTAYAAYAMFPSGTELMGFNPDYTLVAPDFFSHAENDGVVIRGELFGNGSFEQLVDSNNQGKTLIHELGHYFGLFHIFSSGYRCEDGLAGDYCADTPVTKAPYNSSCSPQKPIPLSCDGTPEPIHNFMNYGYDSCLTEFTQNQFVRMRQALLTGEYLKTKNIKAREICDLPAISENFSQPLFNLSPNPTSGVITLRYLGLNIDTTKNIKLKIWSTSGIFIREEQVEFINGMEVSLNFDFLSAGVYWVAVLNNQGNLLHKQTVIMQ